MIQEVINYFSSTPSLALAGLFLWGALQDSLPSPTDPIFFYIQNWLRENRLSKGKYEVLEAILWYALDSLWWIVLAVLIIIFNINNVSTANTITTVVTLIGLGITVSIIWRFLRKKR